MPFLRLAAAACFAAVVPAVVCATEPAVNTTGVHGFDFEFGTWRVHHRIRRPTGEWIAFDGTCTDRPLMAGMMNVEEHVFERPTGVTRGVALRAYDAKTDSWAIWWVDSRDPHAALDPPVKGRFVDGVGTFVSDGTVNGKPVRTRYLWSQITPTSARWEQAFSSDDGASWETNWVMTFRRVSEVGDGGIEIFWRRGVGLSPCRRCTIAVIPAQAAGIPFLSWVVAASLASCCRHPSEGWDPALRPFDVALR